MLSTLPPYVDGWYGTEQELTVIPKPLFPFRNNPLAPDIYSRLYERNYQVQPRLFLPKIANRTSWSNLVTYSEELDNAAWTKVNVTVTANTGTAPDGQVTLDKLLETVTNGEHSVAQAATATAAVTEASIFAVGGLTRSWIRLAFTDSAATVFSAFFNIASGYVGTAAAGVTPIIVPLGNGQFRCVIRFTPASGAGTLKANISTDGSSISYAGNTANGVYLWGGQVTTGSQTPYISTTSATRSISAPDRDKTDPMAYLLEEEEPQMQNSETGIVRRMFGRVPLQQTVPDFRFITKPEIPGEFPQTIGAFLVFQPIATVPSYDGYTNLTVLTDSGTVAATYPTGGTYTLTFEGDTTGALNFNDSAGTVETALDLLASVIDRGGVTVTGSYNSAGGLIVSFNAYAAATADGSSLTSTGTALPSSSIETSNNGYLQTVTIRNLANAQNWNGGTFTVTVFGQTTAAIAYNADAATIQAALNALTEVQDRGNCTVTLPEGQTTAYTTIPYTITSLGVVFEYFWAAVRFNFSFANAVITATSSLTPSGSIVQPAITDGVIGQAQAIVFTGLPGGRTVGTAAHNIIASDDVWIRADGVDYFITSGGFSVPSPTTVTLSVVGTAFATATAITNIGRLTIENYTPGIQQTRCSAVTTFYLIGVTPGISSITDIPIPVYQGDPSSLLEAIFAGSESINYQVGELAQWRETPVLARTIITLNATQL